MSPKFGGRLERGAGRGNVESTKGELAGAGGWGICSSEGIKNGMKWKKTQNLDVLKMGSGVPSPPAKLSFNFLICKIKGEQKYVTELVVGGQAGN